MELPIANYTPPNTSMKRPIASLCLFVFILQCCPIHLIAQDGDEEEVFELSPFSLEARDDEGYRSTATLAGTRIKTNLKDVAGAINVIDASLFQDSGASILNINDAREQHYANASGVIVRFAIGYYDEIEKNRRGKLVEHLKTVQTEASKDGALYYTPGALKVSKGDRKKLRNKPKSHFTSYAHFSLSFTLDDGLSPQKRVASVRQLIASIELESDVTKIYYGEALLLSESPFGTSAYNNPIKAFVRSARATSDLGASIPFLIDANGNKLRESTPLCSTTLIKPADSIQVQFAFDTQTGREGDRIQALNSAMKSVIDLVAINPDLSFSHGSILLRHGDSTGNLSKPSNAFTSQAQFLISFDIEDDTNPMQGIYSIRDMVRNAAIPDSINKIHYGAASLVLENPQQYHSELLAAVFSSIESLQEKLGETYEVIPQLAHKRVQQRRHSLTEVEVWIPYDYKIDSIRERDQKDKVMMLEHERELAATQASAQHCRYCTTSDKQSNR